MLKKIFTVLFFVLCLVSCSEASPRPEFDTGKMEINGKILDIEIADELEQRSYGLMFKKSIPNNYGMLFVYKEEVYPVMWMKNTYIPLDMIFVNEKLEIVQVYKNAKPLSLDKIYCKKPAKYILEVESGFIEKENISIGDKIKLL